MKKVRIPGRNRAAFTIIELLVVVIIIAIAAGLSAGFLGQASKQRMLTQAADNVLNLMTRAKSQVMADGRAYTFCFMGMPGDPNNEFFVNALEDGNCWSNIRTHCIHRWDNLNTEPGENAYTRAGVMITKSTVQRTPPGSACPNRQDISANEFTICFSPDGYAYMKLFVDQNATCDSITGTVPNIPDPWNRICGDGAKITFNRMLNGIEMDVDRTIVIPPTGVAYLTTGTDGGP